MAHALGVQNEIFSANLSIGSSGIQVMALQQLLNKDPATRVSADGPGSPGNETGHFGTMTRAAVIRFQEKYADEILIPAGLIRGNGRVGLFTRAKLNALVAQSIGAQNISQSTTTAVKAPAISVATATSTNPNLKNSAIFLAAIDNIAVKKGMGATAIATMNEQMLKALATTTDLRTAFIQTVEKKSALSLQDTGFLDHLVNDIGQILEKTFVPERAYAATGVPFGGALLFTFYCWNSNTWLIGVEPLPPSFASILTYVPESQAFLSYNIPATTWLLGEYAPGAGVCVFACPFCVSVPSEGMITPMTGSSPL